MNAALLAEVALEVAECMPDDGRFSHCPRAEWRWHIVETAKKIIADLNLTTESEDLDELVRVYMFRLDEMEVNHGTFSTR